MNQTRQHGLGFLPEAGKFFGGARFPRVQATMFAQALQALQNSHARIHSSVHFKEGEITNNESYTNHRSHIPIAGCKTSASQSYSLGATPQ